MTTIDRMNSTQAILDAMQDTFASLVATDATVSRVATLIDREHVPEVEALKACVCWLAQERDELRERMMRLESIAPKRILSADGRIARWDAPDDSVPIS